MPHPKPKPATYADIEALPPNVVGEIIYGSLITQPRPARRHVGASSGIFAALSSPFQGGFGGPGGWLISPEPELHLGSNILVPDIAGWRRERLVGLEEGAWFDEVPDWVCEIISPSTEVYDRGVKRRIYANFEVPFLWHIDPRSRLLEVFRRQGQDWLLVNTFAGKENVSAPPFDAITFSLGLLWPFDPPVEPTQEGA